VIGANRDEVLERPATAMTVLRASGPRVLGGRDELAGGTWLAVNEHGVVAGLTNRPASVAGRDPTKRSRGELPLALASHATAREAVGVFAAAYKPSDFNPAWLLVGDAQSLWYVDMTGEDTPAVTELPPGVHVLENRPLEEPSAKVARVRALLARGSRPAAVLADHERTDPERATSAACVHTEKYGTRWSAVVTVDAGARPRFTYADGPPCTTPFADASPLWARAIVP
jgi:uncharacterized protein with NRDE domain